MTVWEQGKFLSATSSGYVIYSFLRHLPRADICRYNTWLFLSNFLKWILGGILFLKMRFLSVYIDNRYPAALPRGLFYNDKIEFYIYLTINKVVTLSWLDGFLETLFQLCIYIE